MNRLKKLKPGWGLLPIAILLALWETVARLNLVPGEFTFPSFSAVMQEFYLLTISGVSLPVPCPA